MDVSTDSRRAPTTDGDNELTPLEQEVLDEYAKLVGNLDNVLSPIPSFHRGQDTNCSKLSGILAELASKPSAEILDALRGLERKTTTVFTLLKASVYSIVLQQEIFGDEQREDGGGGRA